MDESTKMLNDLLAQLGKSMQLDDLQLDEDGFCSVGFDDRITITVHSDSEAGTAVFSAEIGTIPPDNELDLYRAMLQANFAWNQTGGIGTLCLAPDDENPAPRMASIMHQTPVRSLDEASFQNLFDQFLETAEAWTNYIEDFRGDAPDQEDAPAVVENDPNLRRV